MSTSGGCDSCTVRVPIFGEISFAKFVSSCCKKVPDATEEQNAAKAADTEQHRVNAEKARLWDEGRALVSTVGHVEVEFLHQELKRVFRLDATPQVQPRRLGDVPLPLPTVAEEQL